MHKTVLTQTLVLKFAFLAQIYVYQLSSQAILVLFWHDSMKIFSDMHLSKKKYVFILRCLGI